MDRNGLIVMTGLPITRGHGYLTKFAANFMQERGGTLYVMLYSRSFEPVPGEVRVNALRKSLKDLPVVVFHIADDDVPQNPSEDPIDFWGNWKNRIRDESPNKEGDFLFASELYGIELSKILCNEFVPCDIHRDVIHTSGTKVRKDPIKYFSELIPEIQPYFRKTLTLFGQESCGKTTMMRELHSHLSCYSVPEWAREYLECVGPEINSYKMSSIVNGQHIAQKTVSQLCDRPFIVQDTDLLSTIGYYRLWSGQVPDRLVELFEKTKSDLYFVMNDNIPFESDPLRYGGDKRETTRYFWIELLREFKCNYHVVEHNDLTLVRDEILCYAYALFNKHANMAAFVRT